MPAYLTAPQVKALLDHAPHPAAKLLITLQWRAGLRVAEALAVRQSDIAADTDQPTLRVRRGKGGKERLVPLHPDLAAAIAQYCYWQPRSKQAGPLLTASARTALRWVVAAADAAIAAGDLPPGTDIGTHALRHSAARHWLASGVPMNRVQVWLGHAQLATTVRTYLPLVPDPGDEMGKVA